MDLSRELITATDAAIQAGKIIAKFYGKQLDVEHKSDNQPVTEADLQANAAIKELISDKFPEDGWLSEEDIDNVERLDKSRVWIVDPLDGTKDFIHQIPEFAVSIALTIDENPSLGVVYNPITNELFHAIRGKGAFLESTRLQVKPKQESKTHLIASRSEFKRGEWNKYKDKFEISTTGGCAYKMCKVARGDADGTFTLNPKSEWDICAGHLIIEEAGGIVKSLNGYDIEYNQKSTLLEGLIYCNDEDVLNEILEVLKN
jgi:myo-inositol-1(or 4)-monophosphatase